MAEEGQKEDSAETAAVAALAGAVLGAKAPQVAAAYEKS